jgi:integrase
MATTRLTKKLIDDTQPDPKKDLWLPCHEVPGFGVRVQSSGRKTYLIRYRTLDGIQRKFTLARCCDMHPEQARNLARKAYTSIADGGDPASEKSALREAPTIHDLSERYMREHAIPYKKPRSVYIDAGLWKRVILPKWGTRRVDSITRAEVITLHSSMSDMPVKANHTLALLSKAMNLAEVWGWRTGGNPCRLVRKYKTRQIDNILSVAQIGAIDAALTEMSTQREIPQSMADLIRLLMLTGCRLSEIMTARQEWIDRDRRLLVLPDSKTGQRWIHLSDSAMAIVADIKPGQWLIPGRRPGTHLYHPWQLWRAIQKRAGIVEPVRLHDIRHTVGSLAHRSGMSQREIAQLLGHKHLITTQRYLHGYQGDGARSAEVVAGMIAQASTSALSRGA